MSLLMDALKRAEKAREAQAEKADARGELGPGPFELALDPIDDSDRDTAQKHASAPAKPAALPLGTDSEDSLDLTADEVKQQIEAMADSATDDFVLELDQLEVEDSPPRPGVTDQSVGGLSLDYGEISLDDTGSTLPSIRAAQRSVQDYFDSAPPVATSMDGEGDKAEPPGDASAEANGHVGQVNSTGETTSRRRAQSVIDARVRAPSSNARKIAVLSIALLLIAGAGGAAFFFRAPIMALFGDAPTRIARQRPIPVPATAASQASAAQPSNVDMAAKERENLLRAAEQARAEEAAAAQALADAEEKRLIETQMQAKAAADAAAEQAKRQAEAEALAAAEQAASAAAAAQSELQASAMADETVLAPAAFKISRRRGPGQIHNQLVSAFEAFQRGDDEQAMKSYLKVLSVAPRNRDAMLGAAAVSMRAGAFEQATSYYMQVLRRNPRDGAAHAGLMALQDNLDPVAVESRVKQLLVSTPQDANLHFSLGNLYAEQGRWAEAQQSYFEAYRLDSMNPDYAFNLAVSLDRLAQAMPALEYYRRANELASEFPTTFDPAVARRRAAELSGS